MTEARGRSRRGTGPAHPHPRAHMSRTRMHAAHARPRLIDSEVRGAGFVPIRWRSCAVPVALSARGGTQPTPRGASRTRKPSATSGFRRGFCLAHARVSEVRMPPTHRFLPRTALEVSSSFYTPLQRYQQHALAGGGSGLWGSSCRPSACGRRCGPVPVAYGLHGRWRVALFARRHQQARATLPWVGAQLQAHAQPVQLVRALVGGPPPHAMAQHRRSTLPRTARPTRRAPSRSQAMRWSVPCAAAHSRALCRLLARHVAGVEHAETAWVHPWVAPHLPTAPG